MMMMTIIITTMMMMMTRSQDVSVSVPPWSRLAVGFDWLPSGSTACIVNRSDVNDDDDDDDDDDDNDDDNDDNYYDDHDDVVDVLIGCQVGQQPVLSIKLFSLATKSDLSLKLRLWTNM